MSGTSSTPGREAQLQPSNPRIYRAMSEEIDRLTTELEGAHAREAHLREELDAHRIYARQWQTRAEEAERGLSRIQGSFPEFNNAWRAMGQAFANVTGQVIDDGDDAILLPEDTQNIHMADDESTPVFDPYSMRRSNRGSENSEPLLPYAPNTFSRLGSDVQLGSSLRGSSLSGIPGPRRGLEPELQGLEGHSSQRPSPPPPPPTNPTNPRQSPPQPSLAEITCPRDSHAAPSHVADGRTDITNRREHHVDMQEDSPTVNEYLGRIEGNFLGIPNASTTPATPTRHTPTPRSIRAPWNYLGEVSRRRTVTDFFEGWPSSDEEEADSGNQPEG